MDKCLFCRIISRELPSEVIYEDNRTLAFMDINPGTRGHCLVIPKVHAADIFELSKEDAAAVMRTAHTIARAMHKSLDMRGLNLHQSNGKHAGQVIMHFHLHLLPRYQDDSMCTPWKPGDGGTNYKKIAGLIRNKL